MPTVGINVPDMGRKAGNKVSEVAALYADTGLSDALFGTTRQRVLGCLFGQPDRSFTVSELIHTTGAGSGAVQREVARLAGSGLLTVEHVGNQKRYQSNRAAPIHHELVGIVQKTVGLAEPLRAALQPLASKITAAFVFGSVAKRSDTARSDIDLMVVGDASFADVVNAVYTLHERLAREVNPVVMTAKEFRTRVKDLGFVARVLSGPRIPLLGELDDT
jgi:predicted nucleotidyltransferase